MLQIVQFIFSSIWHYLGTVVLIIAVFSGLSQLVRSLGHMILKSSEKSEKNI